MRDIANTLLSSAFCLLSLSTSANSLVIPGFDKNGIIPLSSIQINNRRTLASGLRWSVDNSTSPLGNTTSGTNSTRSAHGKRKCTNPRIRREWRRLSNQEKLNYLAAVQCMHTIPSMHSDEFPGAKSHFDDFVGLHITITNATTPIHNNGLFLPWHRRMLWMYETSLIENCGYKGAQPFWDYYLDGPAYNRHFNMSPIWDPVYGFGGNGVINQTLADQNQPASPWGDGPVHPPGFNPWGDEPVHPPKDDSQAAQVEKPSGAQAEEDPWGKDPVHPPIDDVAQAAPSQAAQPAPAQAPAPAAVPNPDGTAPAATSPMSAGDPSLGAPVFEDGETPSDEGWTRRRDLSTVVKARSWKRQVVADKKGPEGSGQTPLSMGGPAWPFISFLPILPPFLVDGLLRPNDDDDDAADGDDDAPAANSTATPVDNPSVASQRPKRGAWGCIDTGPFANWTIMLGPGLSLDANPRCLQRGWNFEIAERALTADKMEEVMSKTSYAKFMELDFETNLNMGPHTVGHRGVGGDMYNLYSSPNEPVFYMHHTFIDRLWTLWQGRNASRIWDVDANYDGLPPPAPGTHPLTGRTSLESPLEYGVMGPTVKISTVMDTLNREEDEDNYLCYTYDDAEWDGGDVGR